MVYGNGCYGHNYFFLIYSIIYMGNGTHFPLANGEQKI